jgi:membrane associated rhomboid family serine protease
MKYIARRFLTLLAAVVVGALLGGLGGFYIAGGWAEGMIFGGMGGAVFGMLYDPRAATYTVPTRGGAEYPGNRDDYRP